MRIAILGAGYAGLTLARKVERNVPDAELVVVEKTGRHLVQHEVHRAIRRPSIAEDIVVPLEDVLDRAEVRRAEVTDVDPGAGVATFDGGETLDYDYAAVCLGAETAFYGLPGVEEHATPLKSLDDAERIRADFLTTLRDGDENRVVVGGAGLSGVQVAGEIAAFADEVADEQADADERTTVVLLERLDTVAPAFPENFQRAVRDELGSCGVEIRTGAAVAEATADRIRLEDGAELDYDQFVWTGGIRGPAALDGDRPAVNSTMRLGDGTFVVGDAARVVDADGEAVPASAQAAIREARAVAESISRLANRDEGEMFDPRLEPFAFDSPGWLVSVGDGAVAQVGPTVFTGTAAKAMKATVGAGYLSSVGAIRNAADLVGEELGYDG